MPDIKDLKTPRQLRTEQVKREILQAAVELIREYGIEYVTVSNICKRAEVSTGSFYHHFGSKDELLAYYLVAAFEQRAGEFEQIHGGDVVKNVLDYYALYNQFLLDQGFAFIKNFYTNSNKGLYSRRNYLLGQAASIPLTQALDRILKEAKENGYLAPDCETDRLIYELSVLEKGVIFDWCLCDGEYDLSGQVAQFIKNYLLRSVVSEKYLQHYTVQ